MGIGAGSGVRAVRYVLSATAGEQFIEPVPASNNRNPFNKNSHVGSPAGIDGLLPDARLEAEGVGVGGDGSFDCVARTIGELGGDLDRDADGGRGVFG